VETLAFICVTAVAVGGIAAIAVSIELQRRRALRDAVKGLGLENVVRSIFPDHSAAGDVDGFRVEIRLRGPSTSVTVAKPGSLPSTLRMEAYSFLTADLPSSERVETGDFVFDEVVNVRGVRATALALLDRKTRKDVFLLVRHRRGWVAGGAVHDASPNDHGGGFVTRDGSALLAFVRSTLDLARRLSVPDGPSIRERLVRNATSDSVEGVRLRNVQALVSGYPEAPETRTVCEAALRDHSPFVRLEAARALGREAIGVAVLESLATDKAQPEGVIAGALEGFALHGPPEKAAPLLIDALKHRRGATRHMAIEQLGRLRHRPAVGPLIVLLENSEAETAAAATRALGAIDDKACEAALVRALSSVASAVQVAAAEVLGQAGSVNAVEPLLAASRRSESDEKARHAARDAARRIQGRLVGAAAGQVALAEVTEPEGALALVDDERPRGELALADDASAASSPPARSDRRVRGSH
jgi:HEAT repeat protein